MEDSMELPSQIDNQDNQEINFFISPNNSVKKHQTIVHTASQQSLAYSSETHARYDTMQRSPIQIQLPNFESSQRPASLKKMIRAAKAQIDKSPTLMETRSEQQILTIPSKEVSVTRQDRRKTINKKEYSNMSNKYKQLQYALQVQVINCEQLRTKVAILTELLEQKIRDSDLSFLFSLKNSSRNLKNIDIFVELKQSQKKLKEAQLIIEQQKQQIEKISDFKTKSSKKENVNTSNYDPVKQMECLMQQKQSLFNYIEQLRKQYNGKNVEYNQVLEELERCQQKQHLFVDVQRPKLIKQISERTGRIKKLERQVEELRMQNNLLELKLQNDVQELSRSKKEVKKVEQMGTMTQENTNRSTSSQTQFEDFQLARLKTQLQLLKSERDYYIQQFKKKVTENSENYLLKLQLKAYEESYN